MFPVVGLLYLRFYSLPFHSLSVNFTTTMTTSQSCYMLLPLSFVESLWANCNPTSPITLSLTLVEISFSWQVIPCHHKLSVKECFFSYLCWFTVMHPLSTQLERLLDCLGCHHRCVAHRSKMTWKCAIWSAGYWLPKQWKAQCLNLNYFPISKRMGVFN